MQSEMVKNKLLECSSAIFHLTAVFREQNNIENLDPHYRDRILAAFDQFQKITFAEQIPQQQVQQAKYALAAYVDEAILSSAWIGRNDWMNKTLQLEFFGEHLAGENFFKRLNELRQNALQTIDVLEIFYICLQLGFEGIFRMRGLDQLLALQIDLRQQIDMVRGVVDPQLATQGLPKLGLVQNIGKQLPFWVIASVTTAIIFFMYLIYTLALSHQTNHIVAQIKVSETRLLQTIGITAGVSGE